MKFSIVKVNYQKYGFDTQIIVQVKKWLRKPYNVSVRGSSTVWRRESSGKRCDTWVEIWLANIWTKAKWKHDDSLEVAE